MSRRACDFIQGGERCHESVHTTVRIGFAPQGAVHVRLCRHHKDTSDDYLVILAKLKMERRETPKTITGKDIKVGLLVQCNKTEALARVIRTVGEGVAVKFGTGRLLGMSRKHLKKNYSIPNT